MDERYYVISAQSSVWWSSVPMKKNSFLKKFQSEKYSLSEPELQYQPIHVEAEHYEEKIEK